MAKGGLKLDQGIKDNGRSGLICGGETCRWDANRIEMPGVTDVLSFFVMHAPVIDETGFTGRFNIHWEWTRPEPPDNRALEAAIEERLGLTLISAIRPIDFLILDQVEDLNAQ